MKLTKEEAIRNHRDMWNWIAGQYELCKDGAFIPDIYNLKGAYIQEHFSNESVKNHCFMCEYAQNQMCGDLDYDLLGCDDYHSYCLLDWGNNAPGYMCESYDSPYLDLVRYFTNNPFTTCKSIDDVINRCIQIANLPVKEELLYTTYEETERTLPGEKDTRSLVEWKEYYEKYVDREEFPDFECWLENNIRLGNLIKETV